MTMSGSGVGMIEDGAVAIKGNRIVQVGKTEEVMKGCQAEEIHESKGKLVMPGFIDAHIHSGLAILRGVAQDMGNWMEEGLWPFMKHVKDDDQRKGSMLNIMEGVKAGTTTFCDYDANMTTLVNNYVEIGARARLAEMINEIPKDIGDLPRGELYPFESTIGEKKLQNNIDLMKNWDGENNGKVTVLFGPHGPDMMSLELLKEVQHQAEKYDTKLHMHVCQGDREIHQMNMRYRKRSIPFLEENGFLNDRLLAVHLTEATKSETAVVAQSGASMINCSGSIGIIDGIVPPILEFLEAGGKAALGSDQAPGNNCNNLFNEMKFVSILNKVKTQNPATFPATKALRLATIESAKAVGLDHEVGSIEVGKKADIIFIDLESPSMSPVIRKPVRNIVPNLVYSANGSEVEHVMVDGKFIMKDREINTLNEKEKVREAQKAAESLSDRASADFQSHSPVIGMMQRGEL